MFFIIFEELSLKQIKHLFGRWVFEFKLLFNKIIYTSANQTKCLHLRKLVFLFINNCLFGRLCSRNVKKTYRPKYTKMFLLFLKRKETNIQKSGRCKQLSLQCVCYWCNLLRWMFFTPCNNWNTSFFIKIYHCSVVFLATVLLLSLM